MTNNIQVQKTLNTNEGTNSFFVNYNTLLHVSTLLGDLQGETFRCRYTRLHYTVKRECAVDCALCRLWRRELFVVSACTAVQYSARTWNTLNIQVLYKHTRLTMNGVLKDILKKGRSLNRNKKPCNKKKILLRDEWIAQQAPCVANKKCRLRSLI
jgi:hypothetical protein